MLTTTSTNAPASGAVLTDMCVKSRAQTTPKYGRNVRTVLLKHECKGTFRTWNVSLSAKSFPSTFLHFDDAIVELLFSFFFSFKHLHLRFLMHNFKIVKALLRRGKYKLAFTTEFNILLSSLSNFVFIICESLNCCWDRCYILTPTVKTVNLCHLYFSTRHHSPSRGIKMTYVIPDDPHRP